MLFENETVDVSKARQRVECFSNGNSDRRSSLLVQTLRSLEGRLLVIAGKMHS